MNQKSWAFNCATSYDDNKNERLEFSSKKSLIKTGKSALNQVIMVLRTHTFHR